MTAIISGFDADKNHCRECSTELKEGDNWSPSSAAQKQRICKKCQSKYAKENYQRRKIKETPEARKLRRVRRILDLERVKRMVSWIQGYNVQYYIDRHLTEAMDRSPADPETAKKQAFEECRNWTYEDVKERKRIDYEVMDEVLLRHAISRPEDGDTGVTWHCAFNECEYDGYELDEDGLPLGRPGILRLSRLRYVRKKGDTYYTGKDGRTGIVSVPFREIPRRPKTEHRIILCQDEDVYQTLDHRRAIRHARDNDQMAKLRLSMRKTIAEKQSLVDEIVGIYNRT